MSDQPKFAAGEIVYKRIHPTSKPSLCEIVSASFVDSRKWVYQVKYLGADGTGCVGYSGSWDENQLQPCRNVRILLNREIEKNKYQKKEIEQRLDKLVEARKIVIELCGDEEGLK